MPLWLHPPLTRTGPTSLLRISLSALHTDEQVADLGQALIAVLA